MSIMDFDNELDEVARIIGESLTQEQATDMIVLFVKVFDRGMSFERSRDINIIKRTAANPSAIVREIRKPIR